MRRSLSIPFKLRKLILLLFFSHYWLCFSSYLGCLCWVLCFFFLSFFFVSFICFFFYYFSSLLLKIIFSHIISNFGFYLSMWFAYMCMHAARMCWVHDGNRRRNQMPWEWSYRRLWVTIWSLGIVPGYSARATGVHTCWMVSPAAPWFSESIFFFVGVLLPSSENWSIFILKIYLIFNLVHEGSLCTWMRAYRCLQSPEEGAWSPKARVTGGSEPPNLGAKNWTQVPWRTASSLNHRALPLAQEPTHF